MSTLCLGAASWHPLLQDLGNYFWVSESLTRLGVLVLIVGMIFLAVVFGKFDPLIAKAAAFLALLFGTTFAGLDLYQLASGREVHISTSPEQWSALLPSGEPVDVVVKVEGSRMAPATRSFRSSAISGQAFLELSGPNDTSNFDVKWGDTTLGQMTEATLHEAGFRREPECSLSTDQEPRAWNTAKISAASSVRLGESSHGALGFEVLSFHPDGTVTVSLSLEGAPDPSPPTLRMRNKQARTQRFPGLHSFLVIFREADLRVGSNAWVAFTVVGD